MERPESESWIGRCDSPQPELKDEIKDASLISEGEVAINAEPYVSDEDIKAYIKTSDPEILREMGIHPDDAPTCPDEFRTHPFDDISENDTESETPEKIKDLRSQLHQYRPFRHFDGNGAINLSSVNTAVELAIHKRGGPALPDLAAVASVRKKIVQQLPEHGEDCGTLFNSLLIIPQAVSSAKLSNHYYGFVSGSTLPIAEAANSLVGAMDLNVMVHDPNTSVAVDIEAATLKMLLQLLDLPENGWLGRTLTSGATGSNILALAAARDALINRLLAELYPNETITVAREGLLSACAMVGIQKVKILSQKGHSSIYKTAGVLGLGRNCVVECGLEDEPWRWDWKKVEAELADDSAVCIAAVSCGEVDTGRYGSLGDDKGGDMQKLRTLMDATRAQGWIHVDGAFGIFARALPETPAFSVQRSGVAGLEYADSIGADAHKCLNVPYESAFLFTRRSEHLIDICSNGSAAYLATAQVAGIISPLNTSLENSRRFRALPIYAALLNLGRAGLAKLFASQILLARRIAARIDEDYSSHLVLLPLPKADENFGSQIRQVGIIVLFRAKDEELNNSLTDRINAKRTIFVSGTMYGGRKAVRIAVAGWDIDYSSAVDGDAAVVCGVLDKVLEEWEAEKSPTQMHHEMIGVLKEDGVEVEHEEVAGISGSESARSVSSTESEGTKLWKQQMDEVRGEMDWEKEKAAQARALANPKPFRTSTSNEEPDLLHEIQNAQHCSAQEGKRPSIVYVGDVAQGGLSGHGTAVPKSEAAQMRRAFDLGVSSFLEEDVGLDGGLEPRRSVNTSFDSLTTAPRCERERESARIRTPGTSHSERAQHIIGGIAPHSPLLASGEVGNANEESRSGLMGNTELIVGTGPKPVYHEYNPKRRQGGSSDWDIPKHVPEHLDYRGKGLEELD